MPRSPITFVAGALVALALALPLPAAAAGTGPFARPAGVRLEDTPWTYPLPWGMGTINWPTWISPTGYASGQAPEGMPPCNRPGASGWVAPDAEDGEARVIAGWIVEDPTTLRIERQRCNEPAELLGTLPNFFPASSTPVAGLILEQTLPGGRACVPSGPDVVCFDTTGPQPTPFVLFDGAALEAQLVPEGPTALFPDVPADAPKTQWNYGSVLPLPDGRVFASIESWYAKGAGDSQRIWHIAWVVEREKDGAVRIRLGPTMGWSQPHAGAVFGSHPDDLLGARLAHLAEAEAVLLVPRPAGLPGGSPGGDGLGFLPLDGPDGQGLIDMSRFLREDDGATCPAPGPKSPYGHFSWARGAGGRFYAALPLPGDRMKIAELRIDRDAADLDRDGLTRAEETTLGTSDYHSDSDGGGSPDGLEVRVDGTNPALATDDRARRTSEHANWSFSELIHARVPLDRHAVVLQAQPVPFVCVGGRCFDPTGAVTLDVPGEVRPALSGDGRFAAWEDATAIVRRALPGGKDEVLAQVTDLAPLLPGYGTGARHAPIVGPRGFVYVPVDQGVLVLGDGPPRLLADRDSLAAEAGLCPFMNEFDADMLARERPVDFGVVGFDPADDRLLARFVTSHETYVVSLGVGRPPVVHLRGLDLPSVIVQNPVNVEWSFRAGAAPEQLLSTSDGGFLARWEYDVTDFRDAGLNVSGAFQHGTLAGSYGGAWGDSFVVSHGDPAFLGVFEVVRIEGRIGPGDLVLFHDRTDLPRGLLVSGPRGGALQLTVEPDTARPIALAAALDGRLCRVGEDGALWLLENPDDNGLPALERRIDNAHDATDCAFDEEGRLVYLAEFPGRLGRIEGTTVSEWVLPGLDAPERLAVSASPGHYRIYADGRLHCLDRNTETIARGRFTPAGMTVTRGGALIALTEGDGRLVQVPDDSACDRDPVDLGDPFADDRLLADFSLLSARLAERPDGLIAFVPGDVAYTSDRGRINPTPRAFDPATGKAWLLAPYAVAPALAIVPGGTWCDPWEPTVPYDPSRCRTVSPDGTIVIPDAAGVPGDRDAVGGGGDGSATGDGGGSGGCVAGSGRTDGGAGGASIVLLAIGIGALGARRRRVGSGSLPRALSIGSESLARS